MGVLSCCHARARPFSMHTSSHAAFEVQKVWVLTRRSRRGSRSPRSRKELGRYARWVVERRRGASLFLSPGTPWSSSVSTMKIEPEALARGQAFPPSGCLLARPFSPMGVRPIAGRWLTPCWNPCFPGYDRGSGRTPMSLVPDRRAAAGERGTCRMPTDPNSELRTRRPLARLGCVTFVGLDPRITLSVYWLPSSHFSVVPAATDARIAPDHDARSKPSRQNESCRRLTGASHEVAEVKLCSRH
jgi:hypothetical protein